MSRPRTPAWQGFGQSSTDPRIDKAAQARLTALNSSDPYAGDTGRDRWVQDGKRDAWIVDFAQAVRRVAPSFGLRPSPTDSFVTAHAAISTGYGRSKLLRVANNAFGIKGNNAETWSGPVIYSTTTEYKDGVPYSAPVLWRVYKSLDDVIRGHLRLVTDPNLRYAKAGEKLRQGASDYMAQLGRDGWYTDTPEKINAMWLDAKSYIEGVIRDVPPPKIGPRIPIPVFALLALATSLGLAYATAVYIEPAWRGARQPDRHTRMLKPAS